MAQNKEKICKNCLWSHPANLKCWKQLQPQKDPAGQDVCVGYEEDFNPYEMAIYTR